MLPVSSYPSVHQLIENQVLQTPNAIAVTYLGWQLSYRQLNNKANQLAHYLKNLGVSPDTLVGVCVDRSPEMVIALLAVLKAGGAYVPLDPAFPSERLAFMVEDSGLSLLLTQESLLAVLPTHAAKVVCLDQDWQAIAQQPEENLDSGVQANSLAYTIYTSGSTGKPKGVQIIHGAVVNFLSSMQQEPGITSQDICLAVTTISFDIAVLELFLPLTVGAQVVIVSRDIATDGRQLAQVMDAAGITLMQATPATWRLLLTMGWQGNPKLKILCGGEALTRSLADQLLERCASLWNMYGPTETTVWSAVYKVESGTDAVPIGHPIANTQIYLIDLCSRRKSDPVKLAATGEIGEIYIGGDGLARGYLNRPEMTEDRFIADPFSPHPEARLYRTGDLGRCLPDGKIQFNGRSDHQVKIRGYRIELGDIETALSQYPEVKEAAVVTREDSRGEKHLVAYVAPKPSQTYDCNTVMSWWKEIWNSAYRLPHPVGDSTFNTNGWQDSYTNAPTPNHELREWLNCTVERILALRPQRVLEIGCGTGLILFRVAPHCHSYVGTDITATAIANIQRELDRQRTDSAQVAVYQRPADALGDILTQEFDTVILNSVVQYFPTINYLVNVLETAVNLVHPGGQILIGDVRSLSLLEAFHTSVQLAQSSSELSTIELRKLIQARVNQDKELVIAPEFFIALQQCLPQIGRVQIQLKRGHHQNELTRFRYDVVLYVSAQVEARQPVLWLDWQQQSLSIEKIRTQLLSETPDSLGITGIPNARLVRDMAAVKLLASQNCPATVADLQARLQQLIQNTGIEPEEWWSLSQDLPYEVEITWSGAGVEDDYDVILRRRSENTPEQNNVSASGSEIVLTPQPSLAATDWQFYANNPLRKVPNQLRLPELRSFLRERLPEYMVPSEFVVMESLPLTPNGKIDRRALPEARQVSVLPDAEFAAPQTPIEMQLAKIWAQILEIEQVSLEDNFFNLGGTSLQVAQLVAEVSEKFQLDLPLLSLFQAPTLTRLAQVIETSQKAVEAGNADLEALDLLQEATLDARIYADAPLGELVTEPQHIFLTGATGFIGAFLLQELLQQTEATIHCLVRASSQQAGLLKIQGNLQRYSLPSESISSRVVPVLGDLSQSWLGMTEDQFQELAGKLDVIYHCGASVNLVYPYSELRAANVLGTQEVLRLASQVRVKPVHFISTLDVFDSAAYAQHSIIQEEDYPTFWSKLENGYAQSKWVAEQLVISARDRGIPTCIYRLGMITGHSQTGFSNTDDLICRLIKGFIQMGSAPNLDLKMNLTPVDFVSQAIVHFSSQPQSWNRAFHLVNPHPLDLHELVNCIRSLGYPLQQMANDQWQAALLKLESSQTNALMPLIPAFNASKSQQKTLLQTLVLQRFNCQSTLECLEKVGIQCPSMDFNLLQKYFAYLLDMEFLPIPPQPDCSLYPIHSLVEVR
jgi:amino acid adenylation domain-containing protein/thioester reductase-like protein